MTAMACKWNGIFSLGEDFDEEDLLKTDWDVTTDPATTTTAPVTGASGRLRDLSATSVLTSEAGRISPHTPQEKASDPATAGEKTVYRIKCLSNFATSTVLSCPPPPPPPTPSCPKSQGEVTAAALSPSSALDHPSDACPDDFDEWDVDFEDLDDVVQQHVAEQASVDCVPPAKKACVSEREGGAQHNARPQGPAHSSHFAPRQPVGAANTTPLFAVPAASPRPVFRSPAVPPRTPASSPSFPRPGHMTPRPQPPRLPHTSAAGLAGRVSASPSCSSASLFSSAAPPPAAPSPLHAPVFTNHLVRLVSAANKTPQKRCVQPAPPNTRRFPGPAGLLPQQLHGQSPDEIVVSVPQTPAHGAVARLRSQVPSSQASDEGEFAGGPWATMKAEMGLDERNPACFLRSYSVVMVLRKAALKQLSKNKVPNMAVMVKTLTHTHADAKAVFRDPTGEIQGTVHRRLLEDRQGDLKAGAVLLLKQVGVFSPSHRNHYLNVTPNNLLRIYSPDGGTWSSAQLSQHSLEGTVPQLEQTSCPPGGTISNMELLYEDEDECGAGPQESAGAAAVDDLAWETDDLDLLLGELPEDTYSH
ncbi:hypothetical protein GJAV_G00216540 [Gymnothorax javanicus]|nr:hypothetical protein GJAV_G00216540 [Gymnothorax javanicus]